MDKQSIGNKIATLRKEKGYTQKQFAEKLHVTDKAISNWERGNNLPDLVILEPLAKELDTTITRLLNLNDEVSVNEVVKLAIEQRNEFIEEIRKESYRLLICYGVYVLLLIMSLPIKDLFDIEISDFIQWVSMMLMSIPLGVAIRNLRRIKEYYKVKII